ncbi:hypothetical protein [Gracilibacillus timonensis]|uniref:hypothetical protein n=1 Tax=Gracilibacillus timonensis TaxID=1816696 RepID=UPI000826576E|nr:hypothetical protein [Gracilibacillus timonensis]
MTIKKLFLGMLTGMLILTAVPVAAEEIHPAKDEVIYATLQPNGTQEDMYVVNSFELDNQGEVTDYGDYTNIKNLTDLSEIEQNGDQMQFSTDQEQFYYQGNLEEKPLPWQYEITYRLNGKEISAEELLGQDGTVQIEVHTSENDQVDPVFFENYLQQISITLDSEKFEDIQAEDGTIANSGKNKQVNFQAMPEKNGDFVLEANVTDFELESMEISAIPASMAIDSPDMEEAKDEFRTLSDALSDLAGGANDLQQGMSELNNGITELEHGSSSYQNGLTELNNGSSELVNGSSSIQSALNTMNESLNQGMQLGDLEELRGTLQDLANGLEEASEGIGGLDTNYLESLEALDQAIQEIPTSEVTEEDIQALRESEVDPELVEALITTYQKAQEAQQVYQQERESLEDIIPTIEEANAAQEEAASSLGEMADQMRSASEQLDIESSLQPLQDGVAELSEQYQSFHSGLVEYTDGVNELTTNYASIHNGISELPEGTSELAGGAGELADGANEISESTSDLPDQLQSEVDEMMNEYDKSDFDPVSFVSDKNEKVETVQFVIKTDAVKHEEEETEEESPDEGKSWWEKLMDLFR